MSKDPVFWQWAILIAFGIVFLLLAPNSKTIDSFFSAKTRTGKKPNMLILTSSLVISWIFAKSITNAANLGLSFGLVGGVSYAVYYLSFLVAGIVIYQLRVKGKFSSIHHFLANKYGRGAVLVFSLLIAFRLFNEIWSNTMVIGSYFGETGSQPYYLAIIVFTILTLAYTIKGGLSSSLLTDLIQMILFGVLLALLLSKILPDSKDGLKGFINSGEWSFSGGLNLLLAAFIQIFSYPFHDPVLTDRGFISTPRVTLRSFIWASFIGFICIVSFSLVGVFAKEKGLEGQAAVEVSKLLGIGAMLAMNFIMVTSAASTLDSSFSSFSKLFVVDLQRKAPKISLGRWAMLILCILGTIPVFLKPEILSATTISGTMVVGLAPVFLLWKSNTNKLSFHLPVWFGVIVGISLISGHFPESLIFTQGKYAALLWANLWALPTCFILHRIPLLIYGKN